MSVRSINGRSRNGNFKVGTVLTVTTADCDNDNLLRFTLSLADTGIKSSLLLITRLSGTFKWMIVVID